MTISPRLVLYRLVQTLTLTPVRLNLGGVSFLPAHSMFDVIIIGGGLAGLVSALELRQTQAHTMAAALDCRRTAGRSPIVDISMTRAANPTDSPLWRRVRLTAGR